MRRLLQLSSLLVSSAVAALPNTILGPGIHDNIVLCNSNNTVCTNLATKHATGAISFSGTVSGGGTMISVNALADATGGPANLRASSSHSLSTSSSYFSQLQSNAEYFDNLTITSFSQSTGSVGSLVITMQVSGTTTPSGVGSAGILWQDSVGNNPVVSDAWNFSQGGGPCPALGLVWQGNGCANPGRTQGNFTGSATLVLDPITFHFGNPFWVDFFLGAGTYPGPSSLSGSADFSHTATLTGLQVFDSSGNPVSNPAFGSAAGVQYTVNGVAPEPASALLIGAGLLTVGAFRFRKRLP